MYYLFSDLFKQSASTFEKQTTELTVLYNGVESGKKVIHLCVHQLLMLWLIIATVSTLIDCLTNDMKRQKSWHQKIT